MSDPVQEGINSRTGRYYGRRSQQTQNISITFVQCWTNVEDVGPILYRFYSNVL